MKNTASLLVRAIIRLYPRTFREQFGAEMFGAHLDQRDASRAKGKPVWPHTISTASSLLRALPAVYADERARTRMAAVHFPQRQGLSMSVIYEIRHAVRALSKQPGFAIIAMLTLALGIGANTAVFSVLNSVVLAPLPYADPDRIVRLYSGTNVVPDQRQYVSGLDIIDVRNQVKSFADVGIMYTYRDVGTDLMVDGVPQRIRVVPVSAEYFRTLGATPAIGRTFTRDEERGNARLVILSHGLWSSLTNSDRNVIGRRLTMNGEAYEVVGVMRSGFRDVAGSSVAAWTPQNLQPGGSNSRGNSYLSAIARLRPGVSLPQAQSELNGLMARLRAEVPDSNGGHTMAAVPLHEDVVGESKTAVYVLMGAASLVLLIACLNVASLFFARAVAQSRDAAIRTALGARRARLVGQRLAESLTVAAAGGVVGTFVAYAGVKLLLLVSPDSLARAEEVGFDPRLLLFALATTLLTGLLFGTAPALKASRVDPIDALHESSRGNTEGRAGRRVRSILVTTQVAAAVVLLIGAGTMIRSFAALQRVDLGFSPDSVSTFDINLPAARYGDAAQRVQFHHRFHEALDAIPGVVAAGATSWLPANGQYHIWGYEYVDAYGETHGLAAQVRVVDGDYFEALRVPLVAGTGFAPAAPTDSIGTAVINSALAQRAYGTTSPIGRLFVIGSRRYRVSGVVGDVAYQATGTRVEHVYISHDQIAWNRNWALSYVVRSVNGNASIAAARRALATIDPALVLYQPRAMEAVLDRHRARQQFTFLLMGVFASIAIVVAAVGVYGVMAYAVTQRTHEIGVRIALGAQTAQVRRIIVSQGVLIAGIGVVAGLGASVALGGALERMVFGVPARDPLVFAAVTALLVGVAVLAGYVPVRRATRIDPGIVLRAQ